MPTIRIHQIWYDDASREALDPAFLPLDNSTSERPDWYEFWAMLQVLRAEQMEEDGWYGVVSPAFGSKTGLGGDLLVETLSRLPVETEVALFSPHLADLAAFRNIFEQGERSHPGLTAAADAFLAHRGLKVDWSLFTNCLLNATYSNYVIARKRYWDMWLDFAQDYFAFCESPRHNSDIDQNRLVPYKGGEVPLRVFVQERLSAVVLQYGGFQVFVPEQHLMFLRYAPPLRRLLIACDTLKQTFLETRDRSHLDAFDRLRQFLI